MVKFTKMHGIGNDYVYVDCVSTPLEQMTDLPASRLAQLVSDRHFGIGSDGLILIKPSQVADFYMEMYNLDGSQGTMCGNGIRSVAKYVYDHKLTDRRVLTIETLAGIKTIELTVEGETAVLAKVEMGAPMLTSNEKEISLKGLSDPEISALLIWEELAVAVEPGQEKMRQAAGLPEKVKTIGVSMGNPHTILFYDTMEKAPVLTLGPILEKHPRFVHRTNVEFIVVHSRNVLEMRVWERGSGETLACGTGACASAVAAMLAGYVEDTVTVKLLGGDLRIHWNRESGEVEMTGPAVEVFHGEIDL